MKYPSARITQFKQLIHQNRFLILLVALALSRGLIYASVTPPWWQGHDEDFHFVHVKALVEEWTVSSSDPIPSWSVEMAGTFAAFPRARWSPGSETNIDISELPARFTRFTRPSWAYYFYLWPGMLLIYQDILTQLFALRLVSVLITTGTIVFAFLSARHIFPGSRAAQFFVPGFILFVPSIMITGSTVSDANAAILFASIIFYLLVTEISRGHLGWRTVVALALTLAAFQAKKTTYFLLIVWGVLAIRYIWTYRQKIKWLQFAVIGGLFLALLILISPTTITTISGALQRGDLFTGLADVFSIDYLWFTYSFFWVIFSWSVYHLNSIWYKILLFFLVLPALGGLLVYGRQVWLKKEGGRDTRQQRYILFSLLFAGASLAGLLGYGILNIEGRSTRYIYPAIIPIAVLMTAGWWTILPKKWQDTGLIALMAALFLFDTLVWLHYALPWYYPFWP